MSKWCNCIECVGFQPEPPDVISREEWQRRYAARLMERTGWPECAAIAAARGGAEEYERSKREVGGAVVWHGSATGSIDSPEECADAEMSNWTDDDDDDDDNEG